jgi:hypothetical protein
MIKAFGLSLSYAPDQPVVIGVGIVARQLWAPAYFI